MADGAGVAGGRGIEGNEGGVMPWLQAQNRKTTNAQTDTTRVMRRNFME